MKCSESIAKKNELRVLSGKIIRKYDQKKIVWKYDKKNGPKLLPEKWSEGIRKIMIRKKWFENMIRKKWSESMIKKHGRKYDQKIWSEKNRLKLLPEKII